MSTEAQTGSINWNPSSRSSAPLVDSTSAPTNRGYIDAPTNHSPIYIPDNIETRERHFNVPESKLKMLSNLKSSAAVCISIGPGLLGTAFGIALDAYVFGNLKDGFSVYTNTIISAFCVLGIGFLLAFLLLTARHRREWPGHEPYRWPGIDPGLRLLWKWLMFGSSN